MESRNAKMLMISDSFMILKDNIEVAYKDEVARTVYVFVVSKVSPQLGPGWICMNDFDGLIWPVLVANLDPAKIQHRAPTPSGLLS